MRVKTIPALMYLKPDRLKALNALAERTRIPRAALVREAIDDLLKKYKQK